MTEIKFEEVSGVNRKEIPPPGSDISEIMNLTPDMIDAIVKVNIYLRDARDCPFARGNWLIDIRCKNGEMLCVKLPKEMPRDSVRGYAAPLIKLLEAKRVKGTA